MTFLDRLRKLGFRTYEEYLKGRHWRKFSEKNRRKSCFVCGRTKFLEVHHTTYERLRRELPSDVVTVCKDCHVEIHRVQKEEGYRLIVAHLVVRQMWGMSPLKKTPPRQSKGCKKRKAKKRNKVKQPPQPKPVRKYINLDKMP